MVTFRAAVDGDTQAIVALNAAVVAVTSPMDAARVRALRQIAAHCIVAELDGAVVGFVLAMAHGAAYENANFEWFSQRLNRFVYVDRIVIGEGGRGQGLGQLLYQQVADRARAAGALVMAAEMDLEPPNAASLRFHKANGFVALGTRTYDSGKVVSMQIKGL